MEIEERIKQFSNNESTATPLITHADQLANIPYQALLRAVVKRETVAPH